MCFVNKRLLKKKEKKGEPHQIFTIIWPNLDNKQSLFFSSSVERNAKMTTHLTDPCLLRSRSTFARECASLTVPNLYGFVTRSFSTKAPTLRKERVERSGGGEGGRGGGSPDFKWPGDRRKFGGGVEIFDSGIC